MRTNKWRGVNLGGWLVVEKWLTPSLFSGIQARDEYGMYQELGAEAFARITKHRDTFITEKDFAWLSERGINAIRLPLGYWVFGGHDPYPAAIDYVDQAMEWAAKHNLAVILDLHAAPGGQNRAQHSGQAGQLEWNAEPNMAITLDIVERLAERYANLPALAGIEILNEPSLELGYRRLKSFYRQAYQRIRRHCGDNVAVIFSDSFKPKRWRWSFRTKRYRNILMDVHAYQLFEAKDKTRSPEEQLKRALNRAKLIEKLEKQRPIIIGEWSLSLQPQAIQKSAKTLPGAVQKAYGATQLLAMQGATGWFYWTYKTEYGGEWSFRDCVAKGWLPKSFEPQL